MFKRLVFGVFAALLLAVGTLAAVPSVVKAEPGIAASVLVTSSIAHPDAGVLDVKMKCGSWNNWCGNGGGNGCGPWNNWCNGGGNSGGCINFGGVQLCTDGGGSNCHWHNGVKYCGSGCGGGGGGGGGGDCYWHDGNKYCNFKNGGDCRWHNGQQYCTGF